MIEELEKKLLGLLNGEFSSLSLTFNDQNSPNYASVKKFIDESNYDSDWVSEDEKKKAMENNSWWTLHWYPDTPVGCYDVSASSLPVLLEHVFKEFPPRAPSK